MKMQAKFSVLMLVLASTLALAGDAVTPVDAAKYAGKIKLACVGDSITQGVGAGKRSYPTQLAEMLGEKWDVLNVGVSAKTMLRGGSAWTATPAYKKALDFKPDVVTIKLGTNDSKVETWDDKQKQAFAADSKALIADFRKVNPEVKIYICLPVPAYPGNWKIDDTRIKTIVCPLLRDVAKETGVQVIDTYAALTGHQEFFPDKVHPNADGATLIAKTICAGLTGK